MAHDFAGNFEKPTVKDRVCKCKCRRITHWLLSSSDSPCKSVRELQQQLNLRTLEQRRVGTKVIRMYKIIHGQVAILIFPYFEQPIGYTRHSRHPLNQPARNLQERVFQKIKKERSTEQKRGVAGLYCMRCLALSGSNPTSHKAGGETAPRGVLSFFLHT